MWPLSLADLRQDRRQVQLGLLPAVEIVPALKIVELRRGEPPLHFEIGDQLGIVADQQQRDPFAFALGDGVRGQGGRDRDHLDRGRIVDVNPIDHLLDADREVALRGQALV